MSRLTIAELKNMRESEDHVEFKKDEHGNVSYNGADKQQPKDRHYCIPGYVIALCNEKVENMMTPKGRIKGQIERLFCAGIRANPL